MYSAAAATVGQARLHMDLVQSMSIISRHNLLAPSDPGDATDPTKPQTWLLPINCMPLPILSKRAVLGLPC